ncbi:MAG TPA: hypothetical protein DCS43_11710 [Verrucomicrobia bacterium]|nr:hypothetical protein [Verrucomicrobiota bacterium]
MDMFIPHSRPRATSEDLDAVRAALLAGHFAQGAEVDALERELCERLGHAHAVVVSSGSAALLLSLIALGVKAGDRVAIPSYTCQCLYSAAAYAGATVRCMDCLRDEVCMASPLDGAKPGVAAAIVPHMFGFEADVQAWKRRGIPTIEDGAQAVGGTARDGSRLGSRGDLSILSFYATKLLPAGEGGACLTNTPQVAETIRRLRNSDQQQLSPQAFNFKMTDIGAALARAKLRQLDENIAIRRQIAGRYDAAFGHASFRVRHGLNQAVCFRYLLEVAPGQTEAVISKARAVGIDCRRPVWKPLHQSLGSDCPQADIRHQTLLSVPLYPSLSEPEIGRICHEISRLITRA